MRLFGALFISILPTLALGENWSAVGRTFHSVDMEGKLVKKLPLGTIRPLDDLHISFVLEHSIEVSERGRSRSRWRCPQLYSYLLPEREGVLVWVGPGGREAEFPLPTEEPVAVEDQLGMEWRLLPSNGGTWTIVSPDEWRYSYDGGRLVSLSHPTKGGLSVSGKGPYIFRIFREFEGRSVTLVSASYYPGGFVRGMTVLSSSFFFDYTDELLLNTLSKGEEVLASFGYEGGLLSRLASNGKDVAYEWEHVPDALRGDNHFWSSVRLRSDGVWTYHYTDEGSTLRIETRNSEGERETALFGRLSGTFVSEK